MIFFGLVGLHDSNVATIYKICGVFTHFYRLKNKKIF
jgi:hypothetical protein